MARRFSINSKTVLELATTAVSASFNFLRIASSAPGGNPVEIISDGSDVDVDIDVKPKGAGRLLVNGSPVSTAALPGGTPGGYDGEMQFNDNNTFGGTGNFVRQAAGDFLVTGIFRVDDIFLDGTTIEAAGAAGIGTFNNLTVDGGTF